MNKAEKTMLFELLSAMTEETGVSYNPDIPMVVVHPLGVFKNVASAKTFERIKYVDDMESFLQSHNREVLVLEDLNRIIQTKEWVRSLRKNKTIFMPTYNESPEPLKGYGEFIKAVKRTGSPKIGLAGGFYQENSTGCLGAIERILHAERIQTELIKGLYYNLELAITIPV